MGNKSGGPDESAETRHVYARLRAARPSKYNGSRPGGDVALMGI